MLSIELTNRCNLNCYHCFSGRHGGRDDFPLDLLPAILADAQTVGFNFVGFTGGEPTIYRHFVQAIETVCNAGLDFGFNSNGWNFAQVYPNILPFRERLRVITFSLDGATEAVHDQLRGKGSYRRVLQAMSICTVLELPFTINMVLTTHNRQEVATMCDLAETLGAKRLRFGHLLPSPHTTELGFDLSPWDRKAVEAEIWQLRRSREYPISIAAGYYSTDLFPCKPLNRQEANIDCFGNLTKCCHLSGQSAPQQASDMIGNLRDMSFSQAYGKLLEENEQHRQFKVEYLKREKFQDADFFPCWYCQNYYGKVDWLKQHPENSWVKLLWEQ